MYVSGNLQNFENRLHQLPISTGDLASFRSEDDNYIFNTGQAQHINREYQKKYYNITLNPSYLTGWYFGAEQSSPSVFNPADYGPSYSWFSARLETGYTDGQEMLTLTDFGTVGMPVAAASSTTRPVWKTGTDINAANNQPLIRYSLDRMASTHPSITTGTCVAIVYRSISAGYIFGSSSVGSAAQGLRATSSTGMSTYQGIGFNITNVSGYNASGWQVAVMTLRPATASLLLFKSNMSFESSPNNYYQISPVSSASSVAANSMSIGVNNWSGDIAEFIWWRSELTLNQRVEVGKKLADIYGITY